MQMGKDTKEEKHHEDVQRLRQQLRDQQKKIKEQDEKLEQVEAQGRMDKNGKDLLWERSKRGDEDWKKETDAIKQTNARSGKVATHTPTYAMVRMMSLQKRSINGSRTTSCTEVLLPTGFASTGSLWQIGEHLSGKEWPTKV